MMWLEKYFLSIFFFYTKSFLIYVFLLSLKNFPCTYQLKCIMFYFVHLCGFPREMFFCPKKFCVFIPKVLFCFTRASLYPLIQRSLMHRPTIVFEFDSFFLCFFAKKSIFSEFEVMSKVFIFSVLMMLNAIYMPKYIFRKKISRFYSPTKIFPILFYSRTKVDFYN